jgi:biopolymer transport protein ExbB
MLDWIEQGGIILMLIGVASLVAMAVVMERFATFRSIDRHNNRFIKKFYDLLQVRQFKTAEDLCREINSPISRMALAGLEASDRPKEDIREILVHAGSKEIPVIEARLGILSTIAYISPLMGLLGTVLGLIHSFQDFHMALERQQMGPAIMAEGIWKALITTVAGLTVGIISYILHSILYTKKEHLILDLEGSSHELLVIFTEDDQS